MARRFDQYCPIAHAMSLVGERWALLIVRELLRGPRRYTDLAAGLPGIGTNILATRLRELEAGGVIRRRRLPPPAASAVYELTEYGAELDEVMHAVARWGVRSLGLPPSDDDLGPDWGVNAFPALFYAERAVGVTETYVVRVDEQPFTVRLTNGDLHTECGVSGDADVELSTDMGTFFELASGDLPPQEAVREGRATAEGDPEALDRLFHIFTFAPRMGSSGHACRSPEDGERPDERVSAGEAAGV